MNFLDLLKEQDMVLRISFAILVLMSLASWSVIFIRFAFAFRQHRLTVQTEQSFAQMRSLDEVKECLAGKGGALYFVVQQSVADVLSYHQGKLLGLFGQLAYRDFLELSIKNAMRRQLQRFDAGLTLLASIGAVAPFIGLFGTVWGIFNALMDISTQGQVSIATISAPIGEALVATALGLFVAIPAVLFYNTLSRMNRNRASYFDHFAHNLFIHLLKEGK